MLSLYNYVKFLGGWLMLKFVLGSFGLLCSLFRLSRPPLPHILLFLWWHVLFWFLDNWLIKRKTWVEELVPFHMIQVIVFHRHVHSFDCKVKTCLLGWPHPLRSWLCNCRDYGCPLRWLHLRVLVSDIAMKLLISVHLLSLRRIIEWILPSFWKRFHCTRSSNRSFCTLVLSVLGSWSRLRCWGSMLEQLPLLTTVLYTLLDVWIFTSNVPTASTVERVVLPFLWLAGVRAALPFTLSSISLVDLSNPLLEDDLACYSICSRDKVFVESLHFS